MQSDRYELTRLSFGTAEAGWADTSEQRVDYAVGSSPEPLSDLGVRQSGPSGWISLVWALGIGVSVAGWAGIIYGVWSVLR